MRLVDRDERDLLMGQAVEHSAAEEAFGRDIEQIEAAVAECAGDRLGLGGLELGM
jgi:hypothetical protein